MRSSGLPLLAALALAAACTVDRSEKPVAGTSPTEQPVLRYVALGDSVATGAGSATSYPELFAGRIEAETGAEVRVTNLAVGGWTTRDMVRALDTPRFSPALADADVVTWNIGGNDFRPVVQRYLHGRCGGADGLDCLRATLSRFHANWQAVAERVRELAPEASVIRTLNYYNPFVSQLRDAGMFASIKPYADEIMAWICDAAEERGMGCANVYAAFNGPGGDRDPRAEGLLADDGLHPSARGQRAIAEALAGLGYEELRAA